MPRLPILSRETVFATVRGQPPGTLRHYEWNKVETELGPMVESRSINDQLIGGDPSQVKQIDMTDVAITKLTVMDDNDFQIVWGTGGCGIIDFNA